MEENTSRSTTQNERRSLALAALIMAIVALFCSFITSWRMFAIAISGAAFIVGLFVLTKVKHKGPSRTMSTAALILSVLGAALACYFLSQTKLDEQREEIPMELQDSVSTDEGTLDRLKNSMDTTQPQH